MLLILMLQDNDIVIMDEPFNGIDLAGTIVLRQWLKEMKATREVNPESWTQLKGSDET